MAAECDLAGVGGGHFFEVAHGLGLGGHGADKAHIQILLPADEGVVGAAEGEVDPLGREADADSGKLGLRFGAGFVFLAEQCQ